MVAVESEPGIVHVYRAGVSLAEPCQVTDENASPELRPYITIEEFKHPWGQNSIVSSLDIVYIASTIFLLQIARINGSSPIDDRLVILGAHQDRQVACLRDIITSSHNNSTNMWPFEAAPGQYFDSH